MLFSFLVPHGPQQRLSDLKSFLDVLFSGDVSLRSLWLVWSGLVSSDRVRVKDPALTVLYFPTVVLSNSVCVWWGASCQGLLEIISEKNSFL